MSSKVPGRKAALDGDWSLDASSRSTWGPLTVNQRRSAAAALHPGRGGALLYIAGLIDDQHRARVTKVLDDVAPQVITDTVGVPPGPPQRCCIPPGVGSPACSAIDQQFFLGRSDSNRSTNARARRRGSTRPNRPAIRLISSSNISGHRAGSTLASAATARSSRVHATRDDHRGGRSRPARHTARSQTTAGVLDAMPLRLYIRFIVSFLLTGEVIHLRIVKLIAQCFATSTPQVASVTSRCGVQIIRVPGRAGGSAGLPRDARHGRLISSHRHD